MKHFTNHRIPKLWLLALLTCVFSYSVTFAQTAITLGTGCSTCPKATLSTNPATPVITPVPSCGVVSGTYQVGTALTASNTIALSLNVSTIGAYSIITPTTNGMTFTGTGTFTATGVQNVTLTGSGTPTTAGANGVLILYGGSACSISVTVSNAASTNGTGDASSFGAPTCTANVINGNMTVGVPVSGVTMSLYANVTRVGTYNITAGPTNGVTFTGSGTFAATGCQLITLTATGTPVAVGSNNFVTNTTPTATVVGITQIAAPTNPIGLGSFSGKTCFDIALSNDNTNNCGPLSGRIASQANFTQAATHTQTYTFTPSGTVSNVRFIYVNTNGNPIIGLTGGNSGNNITTAQTATVNYSTSLNTTALGLSSSNALTGDIYVVYNNGATNNGTTLQLKLTANVKDCSCCGAFVAAGVFKEFMCHNLGADTSLDPNVPVQGIHGNFYQWGRSAVLANASTPAGAIAGLNTTTAPIGAWSDATKTATDPCPSGYRVTTREQWLGVIVNNTTGRIGSFVNNNNFTSAAYFGPNASTKTLTLPAAGYRDDINGTLTARGSQCMYWAGNFYLTNGPGAFIVGLYYVNSGNPDVSIAGGAQGFSVRCIAE